MAIIDNVRVALRITSYAFDSEIETLINAAKQDMMRVGIKEECVNDENNALVVTAINTYCKANFGYDNEEASRFDAVYRQIVSDLLNSDANEASEDE